MEKLRYWKTWLKAAKRPVRLIETVVLDQDQKDEIIKDMAEFLRPGTADWYARHGVPYRRGYLLHGPPGLGKTLLALVFAGIFYFPIYCIFLKDHTLTEGDLVSMFSDLLPRSMVLLEDIDSAGIIRSDSDLKKDSRERYKGISFSGLLNAIDGAGTPEGYMVFMTANLPEMLDDALIRPGRVDMKVGFAIASKSQNHRLFIRIYSGSTAPDIADRASTLTEEGLVKQKTEIIKKELKQLAIKFSGLVPESQFSAAEIQGFLLTRKNEPRRALEEIEG